MKKIEAVMSPFVLEDLRDALVADGIDGMVVSEVRGFRAPEAELTYRGVAHRAPDASQIKVEIVVSDERFVAILEIIERCVSTGRDEARITVLPVEQAHRVRTGERGARAIERLAASRAA
jgi:nitrogen regulatory protein PII